MDFFFRMRFFIFGREIVKNINISDRGLPTEHFLPTTITCFSRHWG